MSDVKWQTADEIGNRLGVTDAWVKKAASLNKRCKGHWVLRKWLAGPGTYAYTAQDANSLWPFISRNMELVVVALHRDKAHRQRLTEELRRGISHSSVTTIVALMESA